MHIVEEEEDGSSIWAFEELLGRGQHGAQVEGAAKGVSGACLLERVAYLGRISR
jgi:hypothetical protein